MRAPLQTRSSASAEAMLGATLELIDRGGIAAVTVAAVAQRAGTSNGALYHRFGDRSGLLAAAQDRALERIEAETAAAFATADGEADDHHAVRLLAHAALRIFAAHRPALRAFLVEVQGEPALESRTQQSAHALATTVTGWTRTRFGASETQAQAAWRMLFALGASQALFDDRQVSATPLDREALGEELARAIEAVVQR